MSKSLREVWYIDSVEMNLSCFIPGDRHDTAEKYIKRVYDIMEQHSLFISHGIIYTRPGSGKSFDDYLVSADTKMYQLKQQRKQKKDSNFLKGVDISSVPMMVDNNIQIMDREGHVCRVFDFLKLNNVNSVRLRIWNEPDKVPESKGIAVLHMFSRWLISLKNTKCIFCLIFIIQITGQIRDSRISLMRGRI